MFGLPAGYCCRQVTSLDGAGTSGQTESDERITINSYGLLLIEEVLNCRSFCATDECMCAVSYMAGERNLPTRMKKLSERNLSDGNAKSTNDVWWFRSLSERTGSDAKDRDDCRRDRREVVGDRRMGLLPARGRYFLTAEMRTGWTGAAGWPHSRWNSNLKNRWKGFRCNIPNIAATFVSCN